MNFAICDDDVSFCEHLEKMLIEYFKKHNVKPYSISIFHSGEDLLACDDTFDIAFLDVEMNGISGIHVGEKLKKENPRTIFMIITSYNDYLDEALHFQAFRYLSKPLDKNRLFRNLKDALYIYNTNNKRIAIETKTEIHTAFASDIVMIEASNRKVYVRTIYDDYISVHNMNYWAETLNTPDFFRTHKSFIINLAHVEEFNDNLISLYHNNFRAYLTYRKYPDFKRAYMLYLDAMT